MEEITSYCSWANAQLNDDASFLELLPTEIRSLILRSTGSQYLKDLAEITKLSQFSDVLLPLYRPLLPELAARWTAPATLHGDLHQQILTLAALARLLPFATYLQHHIRITLEAEQLKACFETVGGETLPIGDEDLSLLLLALFRFLSYDRDMLSTAVGPSFFSSLLHHTSLSVRYVSVQCLCLYMHFADAFSEKLVEQYVGTDAILGQWEGRSIDFRVLKLWEENRWKDLDDAISRVQDQWQKAVPTSVAMSIALHDISPNAAVIGGVLVPRMGELEIQISTFVLTPTSRRNLCQVAKCLLQPTPVLLTGEAGSGKTSLVREAARLLNKSSTMITLHLNEQTDAKSLLGVYTSSADGESFSWKAGVLTKAIQQGRWVLIEDIDRAPAEVMGVLRPILESGELFIASRKERIIPAEGFRILATMRAGGGRRQTLNSRYSWLANPRLWNIVETAAYEPTEIESLLHARYPTAESFIPTILRVHQHVCLVYRDEPRLKALQSRTPSLRDLLVWSRRVVRRLASHNPAAASVSIPQRLKVDIFKDAVDVYAGYLNDELLHDLVASCVAQEMGISPQQMQHSLMEEVSITSSKSSSALCVGRNILTKVAGRRNHFRNSSFALTGSAQRTLDRISAGASYSEPCLLVGETGVGKTTLIQHIANLVGQKLTVVNLSQQSEASDLLGGLKPVTTRSLILPLVDKFNALFEDTFSSKRNEKFQMAISKAVGKQNWVRLAVLWREAIQLASDSLRISSEPSTPDGSAHANKKRKLANPKYDDLRKRWANFSEDFLLIQAQIERGDKSHVFSFVEGRLVQAVRDGEWLLLDEINLASSDTLDAVISLLHNGDDEKPSLLLAEAGKIESVVANPNFRVFAAMNPATDAGKKDLSLALRSRFTEIYVHSGDNNLEDLTKIIQTYLGALLDVDKRAALDLARAYLDLKRLNQEHRLTDGAGEVPHFSIRSLVRCLMYVQKHSPSHGLRRAMYEGFAMSFFTVLSRTSEALALTVLEKHLLSNVKNRKSFLTQQPKLPPEGEEFVAFRHHLVKKGPMSPDFQPHYIRTPSVERNLLNLARAASMRSFPILLQGPTSAGKTSMVEYLCKLSGNKFVRINNHEHTDLQEYLGSYVSGTDGKLQYREGVLVDALRQGHWIVLDELNLAPSDVLEALNRLLDDNRELLIPETQELVHPHPNFMLFATQNPAGLYGGRKRLSRAFRNRFLELHFDDIPEDELETILRERAQLPPSYCSQIVAVYKKLSLQRQSSRLFEQRNSFATLRDLFRWATRPADDRQMLAYHGFMLLAERVRDSAERNIVKKTIEETMKVIIDEDILYSLSRIPLTVQSAGGVVWTSAMRRLFVLVSEALKNNEPVLLVGETGCGKTQICQVIAEAFGRPLNIYNAHSNTETGDLIGSQRPIRNRAELAEQVRDNWASLIASEELEPSQNSLGVDEIAARFANLEKSNYALEAVERVRNSIGAYQSLFTWGDGSLVRSMKTGEHFLLDEISLADDSVLERLNSVLEPSRTILLAEKGSVDNLVVANPSFQFLATMNPGGDYGKRELSAALRNRLTEIWVPPLSQEADILPVVENKLRPGLKELARVMLKFAVWFRSTFHNTSSIVIPLRDLLAWADFVNGATAVGEELALVHGAFMVYIDSIGANPAGMTSISSGDLNGSRVKCLQQLQSLVGTDVDHVYRATPGLSATDQLLHVGPFSIPRNSGAKQSSPELVFDAPTTLQNTMRIVRALQMSRPILLEGSPGVGKTAIVTALAQASGKPFTRINLSDQTDLMDLFGADVPSEDEEIGRFSWRNGPLLDAMQSGGWVLLDEMNLASQSVLEGLNACLDHRQEAYIAELDKSFTCHPEFTLFAAQNPHHQGGGRKGLPASFVNRFTVVYADSFTPEDLLCICQRKFPEMSAHDLETIIATIAKTEGVVSQVAAFNQGAPWEINLRDTNRWLQLCVEQPTLDPLYHFGSIVTERFRTPAQKALMSETCQHLSSTVSPESFYTNVSASTLQVGTSLLDRHDVFQYTAGLRSTILSNLLPAAKSMVTAINRNWPLILTGPVGSGKTSLIRSVAAYAGARLVEFSMNADVDTIDLIGGFEQYDPRRSVVEILRKTRDTLRGLIAQATASRDTGNAGATLLALWQRLQSEGLRDNDLLSTLSSLDSFSPQFKTYEKELSDVLMFSNNTKSQFVWNDGILVDAIEDGSWLVLDNANLCNPSVLDRLNSLLEPNGRLIISEQHGGASGGRVVKPHKNFRIVLTVDPRFGELSRAMRNRSLEISLPNEPQEIGKPSLIQYPYAAATHRFRYLSSAVSSGSPPRVIEATIDNLSSTEAALITSHGLLLPRFEGNEEILTDLRCMKYSNNTEDVCKVLGMGSTPTGTLFPQLLTLNEPWISIVGSKKELPAADLITRTWFMMRRMKTIEARKNVARDRALAISAKDQTLFEKSLIFTNKNKPHSTPAIGAFINLVLQNIHRVFGGELKEGIDLNLVESMDRILIFVECMMDLFNAKTLDYSTFYGHLQIGHDIGKSLQADVGALRLRQLAILFGEALGLLLKHSSLELRTGFSLQSMWKSFKPTVAATTSQLSAQLTLEGLISRFDEACRYLGQSRASLSVLRSRLLATYVSTLESEQPAADLVALDDAVGGLELQAHRGFPIRGKFEQTFDHIYQIVDSGTRSRVDDELRVMALFSPTAQKFLPSLDNRASLPEYLRQLASMKATLLSSQSSIGLRLIAQLSTIYDQPLGVLEHANEEASQLVNAIASHTTSLKDNLSPIVESMRFIVSGILLAHQDSMSSEAQKCFLVEGIVNITQLGMLSSESVVLDKDENRSFAKQYVHHLHPAVMLLGAQQPVGLEQVRTLLIHVSIAGLMMMVPEKAFDPAVYSSLLVQFYERRSSELAGRIDGQRQFHKQNMGQQTSLVIRILEGELDSMGATPMASKIFRPQKSELLKLQELFTRLAQLLLQDLNGFNLFDRGTNQQLKANMQSIIDRLEKAHRAYDDFVKPITWFAKCFLLALEIDVHDEPGLGKAGTTQEIISHTPLLSFAPEQLQLWEGLSTTSVTRSLKLHWLEYNALSTNLAQKHRDSRAIASVQMVVRVLDTFYSEWKSRLSRDQLEAFAQSRYYSYRGDDENIQELDDRELRQMFPDYGDSTPEIEDKDKSYDARATAIKVAKLHTKMYSHEDPDAAMNAYIRGALEYLAQSKDNQANIAGVSFIDILPATLWHMENKTAEFIGNVRTSALNIYVDFDVYESRKLFDLVRQIQARFYTIQDRWPEHAVPADVIAFCNEILHLNISEPVAKLLAKTEKLLEIITQWQSVASREWSVAPLVDQLTALIISWRRLELLSWSRLLDEEQKKHEDDAQAWYFIAYEAVIYNSVRIQTDADSIQIYCKDLARTLEEFLKATTLGQYSSRLALLDTLGQTLHNVAQHDNHLLMLSASVSIVIEHYRRYESNVEALLQTGRAELERALKEQIQLASWKDTNVTALRDSARRSHLKLFRIVKKYRNLLNQPITSFKASEIASHDEQVMRSPPVPKLILDEIKISSGVRACALAISEWSTRPDRLTNPLGSIKSMQRVYNDTISNFEVQLEIAAFREDLISNIKELRTQTPATATDENSSLVRHLQERKRRLLAETLKALAQMGIRRNLPISELEKQSTNANVLISVHAGQHSVLFDPIARENFHELLDVMATARSARKDHSDDLTEGEISRCLGLMEGLLSVSINQRQHLGSAVRDLEDLRADVFILHSFGDVPSDDLLLSTNFSHNDHGLRQHLAWFSEILALTSKVLKFQVKHAKLQIDGLVTAVNDKSALFKELRSELDYQVELPQGLSSQTVQSLNAKCLESLSQFGLLLEEWLDREPRVEFLLKKLLPWTTGIPKVMDVTQNGVRSLTLQEFDQNLRDLMDRIFVALQRLQLTQDKMPTSVEDSNWLANSDRSSFQAIEAMHAGIISPAVKDMLASLQHLKPQELEIASSLLLVASPIIEQYYKIFEDLYQRQSAVHVETCRLGIQLAKSFTTLAKEGFCRPSEPTNSDEQSGKLESGTGLGEGEGAEDISKDVGDDEDLSELAQAEEQEKNDGEIENAEDAVDMGNDDLRGENADHEEEKSDQEEDDGRSENEDVDDMDAETGSVDDLDPSAVDEKMWDDMKNESEQDKELKNDKAKGSKTEDQTAADGEKAEGEDLDGVDGEEEIDEGEEGDDGEGLERPEAENMDPHAEDQQTLDLPEELDFAGGDETKDEDLTDDGMDDLSDVEESKDDLQHEEDEMDVEEKQHEDTGENEEPSADENDREGVAQDDEIMEDQPDQPDEDRPNEHDTREADLPHDVDQSAGGESGAANEPQDNVQQEHDTQGVNQSEKEIDPQQAQPGKAPENEEQGDNGKGAPEHGAGRMDTIERQQNEALRKLADVLDQWHQRREILPVSDDQELGEENKDVDMADVDFEHVNDENDADTQALGAAAADQAQNLDQSKALEDDNVPIDEDIDIHDALEPDEQENVAERFNRVQAQQKPSEVQETGAFVPGMNDKRNEHTSQHGDTDVVPDDLTPDIEHLDIGQQDHGPASPLTSSADATQLWNHCSTTTHQFSLVLTEQLRLILSPTTATKLRGDFRTGKRLNLKRIIPYIASGYKRDKIWMRRSVPSKRNYQIMIAVDDSKSMAESGADILAFETLALLTKSLSMLEAGELCVIGFGDEEHVRVAHAFGTPFSPADSGVNIFQSFSFQQRGTNVRNLIKESIQLFRDARIKGHTASEDLWQLQLVLSDGHCSDHAAISRLVRQAQEEKIIIVFVIVDAGEESILDLKEAVFEQDPSSSGNGVGGVPEMRVRTKRYLEDFPFPYYLVVRDVRDLPGVLATALKGWFGSVVDVQV